MGYVATDPAVVLVKAIPRRVTPTAVVRGDVPACLASCGLLETLVPLLKRLLHLSESTGFREVGMRPCAITDTEGKFRGGHPTVGNKLRGRGVGRHDSKGMDRQTYAKSQERHGESEAARTTNGSPGLQTMKPAKIAKSRGLGMQHTRKEKEAPEMAREPRRVLGLALACAFC